MTAGLPEPIVSTPPPPPPPKKTNPWAIVAAVVVLLCCVCFGALGLLLAFGGDILKELGLTGSLLIHLLH